MLGGGLFGFAGMLIGVPALAVILNIIKKYVNSRLEKKNMPVPSEEYIDIDIIDENGEITYLDKH